MDPGHHAYQQELMEGPDPYEFAEVEEH
jgi:hypothetical protein